MANNTFTICSLFYSILLLFVYYSKKRVNTFETKAYSALIIINLISVALATLSYYVIKDFSAYPVIYSLIPKLLLISYISYLIVFSAYIFHISMNKNNVFNKYFKMSLIILGFYYIAATIIIIILPLEYSVEGNIVYSFGQSASVVYFSTALLTVFWILCMFINFKNIRSKKYFPVFVYLGLMGVVVVVQQINPALLISTAVGTFVTVLMYFTIENPDVKMINELNIAKDQAEKANSAKTDFLSNMSHEIRTPLNAIMGFSQILSEYDTMPDEAKTEVGHILSASDNLLEIVNGILDISKIEANKLEIVNSEYEFKKMVDDLVAICQVKLKNGDKPIEFKYSFDESIPNVLYGDYGRVKQILLNLLTNSIKYTKEGFINFKISSIRKGDIIRLIMSVEDSGIGIKKDKIDKLFAKFERLGVEKDTTAEGTGLGLAITKKLVELMKGKIVVQSEYGEGSKFTVSIDQKIVPGKEKLEETQSLKLDLNNIDFSNKKVLIVDDNLVNLKVASRLLLKYGIVAEEVLTGKECLDKVNEGNAYDLILLDDMMPKMTGTETLKILKENKDFKVPVIALTANAISGMKEKYLASGFTDYMPKPIDISDLEHKLKKYLGDK